MTKKYKKSKNSNLDLNDKSLYKIAEKIKKLLSTKDKVSEIIEGPKGPLKIDLSKNELKFFRKKFTYFTYIFFG